MDNGIVDLVPACKNYDAALPYVALSRYRSLQNIHLLRKFDRDVISKAPRLGLTEFYGKARQFEANLIRQLESNRLYRD